MSHSEGVGGTAHSEHTANAFDVPSVAAGWASGEPIFVVCGMVWRVVNPCAQDCKGKHSHPCDAQSARDGFAGLTTGRGRLAVRAFGARLDSILDCQG